MFGNNFHFYYVPMKDHIVQVDIHNSDENHLPKTTLDHDKNSSDSASAVWSGFYSIFYCVSSVLMVTVNKLVVTNYGFPFNCFLLLIQSFATLLFAQVLGLRPAFKFSFVKSLLPISLVYLANVFIGLMAVRLLSIPVYTVIKRLTPVPTLILDYLLRSKTQPPLAIVGVALLVVGPVLLAQGDLDYDALGYLMGLAAVGVQSLFLVAISWTRDSGFSEIDMTWYNSILIIPPLGIAMLAWENDILFHRSWSDVGIIPVLILFAFLGAIFLFSTILLTSRCSALSLTVVGQLKGLLQIFIGFLWFGHVRLMQEGFIGIAISTVGAAVYAYAKFRKPSS